MSNTSAPITIFTGQRAQIRGVAQSWGVSLPALVDGVDFTPNLTAQMVQAFGSLTPVINYVVFDDVTAKISYPQNNQKAIEALIMDVDPTLDEVLVNPATMQPFTFFANLQGLNGKVMGCYLLRGCKVSGNPFSSTIKEGAKRTLDIKALQAYFISGLGISYARLRGTKTIQAAPTQPTVSQTATGGFLSSDTYYVQTTAVTAAGETTPSNEASIQIILAGDTGTNKLTITTPAIVSPVTSYNVYVSNRSNGERFSVNVPSGTSVDILRLPAATASRPPTQNTSGMPATAGDIVLTSSAGLWTGTLPVAAYKMAQTGLDYLYMLKNGAELATLDNPALEDTFSFASDGTTLSLLDASGDNDWIDCFTLYKP